MCGLSTSINEMIVWRAVQGFIGGGMIPTVFAAAYLIFPRSRMAVIAPMIGLVATLAPTIGPTVGGYLTDALSWHWLFFINVVPGHPRHHRRARADRLRQAGLRRCSRTSTWIGLLSMAGFLGALEYVLEEGPRNDWFDDDTVLLLAWVSAISAVVFFWRVLTARAADRRPARIPDRNFAVGSLFSFVLGIGLYGLTYLYPRLSGADPRLQRADDRRDDVRHRRRHVPDGADRRPADAQGRPRLMLMTGFLFFAIGTWWMTWITSGLGFLGAVLAADLPRRRPDAVRSSRSTTSRSARCRRSG